MQETGIFRGSIVWCVNVVGGLNGAIPKCCEKVRYVAGRCHVLDCEKLHLSPSGGVQN